MFNAGTAGTMAGRHDKFKGVGNKVGKRVCCEERLYGGEDALDGRFESAFKVVEYRGRQGRNGEKI